MLMRISFGPKEAAVVLAVVLTLAVAVDLMRGMRRVPAEPEWALPEGDAARGRALIVDYGCGACHVIPGIHSARGRVGPQLHDLRSQVYLAGRLPNTPENLARWIQDPQGISPGTAMPDLGVGDDEAKDMAVFLYGRR
jgi:cytochrome c